jgi:8-oxo-dGTP diphosphatase
MVVVDVANVMGARADGWWRDRAGAAYRLCREVGALARRRRGPARETPETPEKPETLEMPELAGVAAWVLVLEGRARDAAALLAAELDELDAELDQLEEKGGGEPPLVRVVCAPGPGDDAIVSVVADAAARDETCLVVTADRELRRRCEELNASVVGPGWLLRLL